MQASDVVPELGFEQGDGGGQFVGAGALLDVRQVGSERFPVLFRHAVMGELMERGVRVVPEALVVELVERDAEDPTIRQQPGLGQVEEPGNQLPAGEVFGGAEQQDDVRAQRSDQVGADVGRV